MLKWAEQVKDGVCFILFFPWVLNIRVQRSIIKEEEQEEEEGKEEEEKQKNEVEKGVHGRANY